MNQIPSVALDDSVHQRDPIAVTTHGLPATRIANPLDTRSKDRLNTPTAPTETIGARTVNQEAQAALRPLLAGVQTQEQLDTLVDRLEDLRYVMYTVSVFLKADNHRPCYF